MCLVDYSGFNSALEKYYLLVRIEVSFFSEKIFLKFC